MGCSITCLMQMTAVLPLLLASTARASTADNSVSDDESTTNTVTVTVWKTSTTTITRTAASLTPTPTPDEMAVGVKEYRRQGCFGDAVAGEGAVETMGLVLGKDYIVPKAEAATGASSGGNNMSLSLCLQLCAASVTAAGEVYPFVGLSGGE